MKSQMALACAVLLAAAVAVPVVAGEPAAKAAEATHEATVQTLEGKIVCAKCGLAKEGQTECQNVLVVEQGGKSKQFYMTKNAVYEKYGEVCKGTKAVRVTGEITEQGGQAWVTAAKIEPLDDKG